MRKIITGGWLGRLDRRWVALAACIVTKIIAGGWLGWLDRRAAWYHRRIVTKIIVGPAGAGCLLGIPK